MSRRSFSRFDIGSGFGCSSPRLAASAVGLFLAAYPIFHLHIQGDGGVQEHKAVMELDRKTMVQAAGWYGVIRLLVVSQVIQHIFPDFILILAAILLSRVLVGSVHDQVGGTVPVAPNLDFAKLFQNHIQFSSLNFQSLGFGIPSSW